MPQEERVPEPSPIPEADRPVAPEPQQKPDAPKAPEAPPQPGPAAHEAPVEAKSPPEEAAADGKALPLAERGEIIEATVRRLAPFGAFVRLPDGRKGLIHISQVAEQYVTDIKEHLKVGDVVRARITAVSEDGKVDLSIKKAKPRPKPPRPKARKRPESDRAEPKPPKRPEFHVNPMADLLADVEKDLADVNKDLK